MMAGLPARSVTLYRAKRPADAVFQAFSGIESDDPPSPRHQIDQAFESSLHRVEIFVDVGMIELY